MFIKILNNPEELQEATKAFLKEEASFCIKPRSLDKLLKNKIINAKQLTILIYIFNAQNYTSITKIAEYINTNKKQIKKDLYYLISLRLIEPFQIEEFDFINYKFTENWSDWANRLNNTDKKDIKEIKELLKNKCNTTNLIDIIFKKLDFTDKYNIYTKKVKKNEINEILT